MENKLTQKKNELEKLQQQLAQVESSSAQKGESLVQMEISMKKIEEQLALNKTKTTPSPSSVNKKEKNKTSDIEYTDFNEKFPEPQEKKTVIKAENPTDDATKKKHNKQITEKDYQKILHKVLSAMTPEDKLELEYKQKHIKRSVAQQERLENAQQTGNIGDRYEKMPEAEKAMYDKLLTALFEQNPELFPKFIDFFAEVDSLSYLEKKDEKGKKIFNEGYLKKEWVNSLYGIIREIPDEKIPNETLSKLIKNGKIKDPTVPFTKEELEGEIGKIKIGEKTIADLCKQQSINVKNTLNGLNNASRYAKDKGIETNETSLGNIAFHDYPIIESKDGKKFLNKIDNKIAFIATKAEGKDTYISWDEEHGKFHINSFHPNLHKIVELLNEKYPGCAKEAKGTMVFGKIQGFTKKEFLDIVDPKILKKSKLKINPAKPYITLDWDEVLKETTENENSDAVIEPTVNNIPEMTAEEKERREQESIQDKKIASMDYMESITNPTGKKEKRGEDLDLDEVFKNEEEKKTEDLDLDEAFKDVLEKPENKTGDVSAFDDLLTPVSEEKGKPKNTEELTKEELIKKISENQKNILTEIEAIKKQMAENKEQRRLLEEAELKQEINNELSTEVPNLNKEATELEKKEYENKLVEIEKERDIYKIDWEKIENFVNKMLGKQEQIEYKKKDQIKYTFKDNLPSGLANGSLNQIHNETGKRTYPVTKYFLENILAYIKAIEEGKKLGFINKEEYDGLLKKYQQAKDVLEKEYEIEKEKGEEKINEKLVKLKKEYNIVETEPEVTTDSVVDKKIINEEQTMQPEQKEKQPFSFDLEFIKNKIKEILKTKSAIKEIKDITISSLNNELILNAKITAGFFRITTEITLRNAHIINSKDGLKLDEGFSISATKLENKVKGIISKNMDKLNDELIKIIEQEKKVKVEKIWIEDGQLKAL